MNRGPSAASLELSESQRKLLTQYAHKHTVSRQMHQRISIILQAHQGGSNMHIARLLEVTSNTVKKWRTRWIASYEQLCVHQQQTEREGNHLQQMLAVLEDAPRSGSPMRISLAEKQRLMALACQNRTADAARRLRHSCHAVESGNAGSSSPRARNSQEDFPPLCGETFKKPTNYGPIKAAIGCILRLMTGRLFRCGSP